MEVVFRIFKGFSTVKPTSIEISLFLDPVKDDIKKAHQLGADAVELRWKLC